MVLFGMAWRFCLFGTGPENNALKQSPSNVRFKFICGSGVMFTPDGKLLQEGTRIGSPAGLKNTGNKDFLKYAAESFFQ